MKTIHESMIEEIMEKSIKLAHKKQQTVGRKNDYYITLQQLQEIIENFHE